MTIRTQIKSDIPRRLSQFPKLGTGKPYRHHAWKKDRNSEECLFYIFDGARRKVMHIKKIPLKEFELAVKLFQRKGAFNRADYDRVCPIASTSGPCGFAVVGRYLEFRYSAAYQGHGNGFA
jgi:hypothetical protein